MSGGRSWARLRRCVRRRAAEYLRAVSFERCSFCASTSASSASGCSPAVSAGGGVFLLSESFWLAGVLSRPGEGSDDCATQRDAWNPRARGGSG